MMKVIRAIEGDGKGRSDRKEDEAIRLDNGKEEYRKEQKANYLAKKFLNDGLTPEAKIARKTAKKEYLKWKDNWVNETGEEIEREEVRQAIRQLATKKAAGCDGIKGEMYKELGEYGLTCLTMLFNVARKRAELPRQWRKAAIIPLRKIRRKRTNRGKTTGT